MSQMKKKTKPKLKPCPFCGWEVVVHLPHYNSTHWVVSCCDCNASIAWYCNKEETILAWNQRAKESK